MNLTDLDTFTKAYINAALWSTLDESDESGGDPLDQNYDITDPSPSALDSIAEDCRQFQSDNAADLNGLDPAQCGHDFWLTRNGHGAGFWDRGLGAIGARLTTASKVWGSADLVVGHDGWIYTN